MNRPEVFPINTNEYIEFIDITNIVSEKIKKSGVTDGIVTIYTAHTTAGITINENADPAVRSDMKRFFKDKIPHMEYFEHMEGNSPSHILSSLISPSETIILNDGKLLLGTWQGIFFCEFDGPRKRKVYIKIING
ncbi:MAG: secondary thiamine-phosphate synthase enzyme YjbQ [Acidobacteriota bacterium]